MQVAINILNIIVERESIQLSLNFHFCLNCQNVNHFDNSDKSESYRSCQLEDSFYPNKFREDQEETSSEHLNNSSKLHK